jgi:hypothetical protein
VAIEPPLDQVVEAAIASLAAQARQIAGS